MNEKNFDIYLEFQYTKLNLAAFNKLNGKLKYYKEQPYKSYFNNKELIQQMQNTFYVGTDQPIINFMVNL